MVGMTLSPRLVPVQGNCTNQRGAAADRHGSRQQRWIRCIESIHWPDGTPDNWANTGDRHQTKQ